MTYSHEEYPEAEGSDEFLVARMHEHANLFDTYVRQLVGVQTVDDYRYHRKDLKKQAKDLYSFYELAGEPVALTIADEEAASLVDYSTNHRFLAGGDVAGYVAGYYVAATPIGVDDLMKGVESVEDLEQTRSNVSTDSVWRNSHNPIQLELGMRLRPIIMPFGCDDDQTYIEVPLKKIEAVYEMNENHPLITELTIFEWQTAMALRQSTGGSLSKDVQAERVTQVTKWMSETTPLKEYRMDLALYNGSHYLRGSSFASAQASINNEESDEVAEVYVTTEQNAPIEAYLLGFDWLLSGDESDDDEEIVPVLYALLELTDENDVARFGDTTIALAAEDIRFGVCYPVGLHPHNQTKSKNIFQHEAKLFDQVTEYFENIEDDSVRHKEVRDFLQLINNPSSGGKLLESHVALRLDFDRMIGARLIDDNSSFIEPVLLPEWYECVGVVKEFVVRDISEIGEQPMLEMLAVLNVEDDRYFNATGVQYIEVPLQAVASAAILSGRHCN